MEKTRKTVTSILDQIAQELGVSKKTVSRVLGGKRSPVYHKATERSRQILEIARRLKYRPNAAAKAVVTGKFHCVTLLLSPLREEYSVIMPGLLDGMYDGLAEQNYHLMMARVEETEIQMQAPHSLPKALRENMSDGFLINYFGKTPDRLIEWIKSYDI